MKIKTTTSICFSCSSLVHYPLCIFHSAIVKGVYVNVFVADIVLKPQFVLKWKHRRRNFLSIDFYFSLLVLEFLQRSRSQMTFPVSIDLWLFYWVKLTKTHQTQLHAAMAVSSTGLIQLTFGTKTCSSCLTHTKRTSAQWTARDVGQDFGCCRMATTVHFNARLAIIFYSSSYCKMFNLLLLYLISSAPWLYKICTSLT